MARLNEIQAGPSLGPNSGRENGASRSRDQPYSPPVRGLAYDLVMLRKTNPSARLKIAQVAPLSESVPPKLYGGTERVVAYLTDELVRQGHDVTLFASGDSQTSARLVAASPEALRLSGCREFLAPHLVMLEQVVKHAHEFDVIHFHIGLAHYQLARRLPIVHLTTLHGRLDLPELVPLYR